MAVRIFDINLNEPWNVAREQQSLGWREIVKGRGSGSGNMKKESSPSRMVVVAAIDLNGRENPRNSGAERPVNRPCKAP